MSVRDDPGPPPWALRIEPLVDDESGQPRADHLESKFRRLEDVVARIVAARQEPVGEQHREERDEERSEQIQERLVVPQVDDQRTDGCHQGHPADEHALRHARQQVLQADRSGVDVRERLIALVHGQREQGQHACGAARRDCRQQGGRVTDVARQRDHRAECEQRDRRHEVPEPRHSRSRPPGSARSACSRQREASS